MIRKNNLPVSQSTFELAGILKKRNLKEDVMRDGTPVLRGYVTVQVDDCLINTRIYIKKHQNNNKYRSAIDVLSSLGKGDPISVVGRYKPSTFWSTSKGEIVTGQHQFHAEDFDALNIYDPVAIASFDFIHCRSDAFRSFGFVNTNFSLEPVSLLRCPEVEFAPGYNRVTADIYWSGRGYELTATKTYQNTEKQYNDKDFENAFSIYEDRISSIISSCAPAGDHTCIINGGISPGGSVLRFNNSAGGAGRSSDRGSNCSKTGCSILCV